MHILQLVYFSSFFFLAILQIQILSPKMVRIKGIESGRYIAVNSRGKLISKVSCDQFLYSSTFCVSGVPKEGMVGGVRTPLFYNMVLRICPKMQSFSRRAFPLIWESLKSKEKKFFLDSPQTPIITVLGTPLSCAVDEFINFTAINTKFSVFDETCKNFTSNS